MRRRISACLPVLDLNRLPPFLGPVLRARHRVDEHSREEALIKSGRDLGGNGKALQVAGLEEDRRSCKEDDVHAGRHLDALARLTIVREAPDDRFRAGRHVQVYGDGEGLADCG